MIRAECNLRGERFSPLRLKEHIPSDIPIDSIGEPGQSGIGGRFNGVPIPFGACRISAPDYVVVSDRIEWMTEFVSRYINLFRANGVTDIVMNLDWTGVQGNMEFTPAQLKSLADLQIPLTVTYRHVEE
jgi:hypothetical protein